MGFLWRNSIQTMPWQPHQECNRSIECICAIEWKNERCVFWINLFFVWKVLFAYKITKIYLCIHSQYFFQNKASFHISINYCFRKYKKFGGKWMMLKQNTKFRLPHKILAQNLLVKVPLQHKTTFKIFGVLFFVDCTHHTYDICLLIISIIL